jgi:3',5'-cyclic AMP phosphodiesterase CpdA
MRGIVLTAVVALVACRGAPRPAAPAEKGAPTSIRYLIGGDARGDDGRVVPWAFRQGKARGAVAMIFLGDMEVRPDLDDHFLTELAELAPVPFYPVLGNHEAARRGRGTDAVAEERARAFTSFRARFLGKPITPIQSVFDDRLVYGVDLAGGVHFIALDNVSRPGFGADQLAWLRKDLERVRAAGTATHIVVGMHKALVGSGVTRHAMEEDGPLAAADSAAALELFEQAHVEVILASHFHGFAEYAQRGIRSFITGGLGAPLDRPDPPAHHVLVAYVPPHGPMTFEVVPFPGPAVVETGRDTP